MIDDQGEVLDFNFWPSFADMMLALVLILIIIIFIVATALSANSLNLDQVRSNQERIAESISKAYGMTPKKLNQNTYGVSTAHNNQYDIIIRNEPTMQKITFSDQILFNPDEYSINGTGEKAMNIVGSALKQDLPLIREIQIQGYADITQTYKYSSNMELAALRAISVFEFLKDRIGIDPASHLMSATSFGEFKPVQRQDDDLTFNNDKLQAANANDHMKQMNRRVELLLFFKT